MAWRDRRLIQRLGLHSPLIQAPMAGAQASDLAIAVARGGGLGSIPCALLSPDAIRSHVHRFREATGSASPLNLNFFCHTQSATPSEREAQWHDKLAPYYREYGVDPAKMAQAASPRVPFDESSLALVQELRPEVVSFHFGLPARPEWLEAVKATGALVMSSATTVREARWLEARGCDVIIAQGFEAGGHRGVFLPRGDALSSSPPHDINSLTTFSQQLGTMALVPQIVDAVSVPVIAAGGIGDARGILAASVLGAAGVQMGTVFLLADEMQTSRLHREALKRAGGNGEDEDAMETAITNVFTGRPARGFATRVVRELGPMSAYAPEFPNAGAALGSLKAAAEERGDEGFSTFWSGQSPGFAQEQSAEAIVRSLKQEVEALLTEICSNEP